MAKLKRSREMVMVEMIRVKDCAIMCSIPHHADPSL
jgi:hypothetical protein